ncbi:MAG: PRC-barrel domain-containing protein [Candidatus Aenigmatarchaeota archaeon]
MLLQASIATRAISFSKDVMGKEVIDSAGFRAGRLRDVVVRFADGHAAVAGIVVHNRFVPWHVVKSFGRDVYLTTRWFALGCQPIPGDAMLVCQHILSEKLVDSAGRHIGHVDDIGMVWDAESKELKFDHVLTGPYLSIGVAQGSKRIPWRNVVGVRSKPRALVVRRD